MAKTPKNHGKEWSEADLNRLEQLAEGNTPTRIIALKLGRTEDAVRSKAFEEDISLKPTNQSPYGPRKK
jgi:hypothetical protein